MTPREFLEAVVRLDVAEFSDEYGSIRRAYHAVTAVDALAAHIFVWCRTNAPSEVTGLNDDNHYRGKLSQRSSEFRLLRDIGRAFATAHIFPRRPVAPVAPEALAGFPELTISMRCWLHRAGRGGRLANIRAHRQRISD